MFSFLVGTGQFPETHYLQRPSFADKLKVPIASKLVLNDRDVHKMQTVDVFYLNI